MNKENAIRLFQDQSIRVQWLPDEEKWVFAVVDVVGVLAESTNPKAYWRKLKERLKKEGNQSVTDIHTLKMPADDGKMRAFDVADTEQLLRLIQSIPSPKAEPFKMWLARVGTERIEETEDPEKAFDRAIETYVKKGYSAGWINQRLKSIEIRKDLTDEWKSRGLEEGLHFATLTDIIYKTWADKTAKEYKQFKGLKKENLRDNMTNTELVLNMLAELSTKRISEATNPDAMDEHAEAAKQGGEIARNARLELEAKTGEKVVSPLNAKKGILNKKPDELKK